MLQLSGFSMIARCSGHFNDEIQPGPSRPGGYLHQPKDTVQYEGTGNPVTGLSDFITDPVQEYHAWSFDMMLYGCAAVPTTSTFAKTWRDVGVPFTYES